MILEPRFSKKIGLRIAPFFEYHYFGKSNIGVLEIEHEEGHFFEPASKTFWGGIAINVVFYPVAKPLSPVKKMNRTQR